MSALLRVAVFGVIGLSIAYLLLSIYSRSVRREDLEKTWAADHPDGGDPDVRDAYIELGMKDYESSLRKKLILLVYVVPTIAVLVLLYLMNSY